MTFGNDFLSAEGTGFEPVDVYSTSRLSKPLHYHSANPPLMYYISKTYIVDQFIYIRMDNVLEKKAVHPDLAG